MNKSVWLCFAEIFKINYYYIYVCICMWVCISDCSTWSRNYRQLLKALRVCWSSAIAPAFNLSNTFKGSGELTRLSEKTLLPECSQQTAALTKEGLWQPSLTVTSTTASSPTPQLLEGLLSLSTTPPSVSLDPQTSTAVSSGTYSSLTHTYIPLYLLFSFICYCIL